MSEQKSCNTCASCLMPFAKDTGIRENENYCSLCFHDGKLSYEGNDLKTFQKMCYQNMRINGINPFIATFYTWMIRFAPRWKK